MTHQAPKCALFCPSVGKFPTCSTVAAQRFSAVARGRYRYTFVLELTVRIRPAVRLAERRVLVEVWQRGLKVAMHGSPRLTNVARRAKKVERAPRVGWGGAPILSNTYVVRRVVIGARHDAPVTCGQRASVSCCGGHALRQHLQFSVSNVLPDCRCNSAYRDMFVCFPHPSSLTLSKPFSTSARTSPCRRQHFDVPAALAQRGVSSCLPRS